MTVYCVVGNRVLYSVSSFPPPGEVGGVLTALQVSKGPAPPPPRLTAEGPSDSVSLAGTSGEPVAVGALKHGFGASAACL